MTNFSNIGSRLDDGDLVFTNKSESGDIFRLNASGLEQSLTSTSTGTAISAAGVTLVDSTLTKTFTIAAPVTGCFKFISVLGDASTSDVVIDGAGVTFGNSTAVTFTNVGAGALALFGASTAAYHIISNSGGTPS